MFKAKIVSGCWDEGKLELSGMPKDFILSARTLMVLELDELNIHADLLEALQEIQDSFANCHLPREVCAFKVAKQAIAKADI